MMEEAVNDGGEIESMNRIEMNGQYSYGLTGRLAVQNQIILLNTKSEESASAFLNSTHTHINFSVCRLWFSWFASEKGKSEENNILLFVSFPTQFEYRASCVTLKISHDFFGCWRIKHFAVANQPTLYVNRGRRKWKKNSNEIDTKNVEERVRWEREQKELGHKPENDFQNSRSRDKRGKINSIRCGVEESSAKRTQHVSHRTKSQTEESQPISNQYANQRFF